MAEEDFKKSGAKHAIGANTAAYGRGAGADGWRDGCRNAAAVRRIRRGVYRQRDDQRKGADDGRPQERPPNGGGRRNGAVRRAAVRGRARNDGRGRAYRLRHAGKAGIRFY